MGYCIYKICCDNIDYVYVGSTTNFTNRKYRHKSCCNNENSKIHNIKLYKTIRENGGWSNWRMVIIDEVGDVSKTQAHIKEEEWRQNLKANLNMLKAYATEEQKKEYQKQYYDENNDKLLEQYKQYYEQNRDKLLEYQNVYYENNKEKINKKITCECGCEGIKRNLAEHKKSKKHQAWEWRQTCLST